jgi:signal transduction histidine kinase
MASSQRLRGYAVPVGTAAVGAVLTAFAALAPFVHFAYYSPAAHVALESSAALVALLAAYLLFGRFRSSRQANDLALIYPLALFAFNNLFVSVSSFAGGDRYPSRAQEWVPPIIRLIAAATFALAAFVPPRTVPNPKGAAPFVAAAALSTLTVVTATVIVFSRSLPTAVVSDRAGMAESPTLSGHPALLATYAAAVLLFTLASVGFARRGTENRDELMLWFSGGAALAGVASLNYFLYPSRFSEWVYTGDLFRIGFYALLLVGAVREIESYWAGRAQVAVFEERRRLARDLHDGLAQELAYIWRQARRLAAQEDGPVVAALSRSVERAMHESRRAVAALRSEPTQSLGAAMSEAVEAVAARFRIKVVVDIDDSVKVSPETREQLLRIACEAVANAGQHGGARLVRVEVSGRKSPLLRVVDDGAGFDPSVPPGRQAFGLLSMHERAHALGGQLAVRSRPGGGTRVEVVLP